MIPRPPTGHRKDGTGPAVRSSRRRRGAAATGLVLLLLLIASVVYRTEALEGLGRAGVRVTASSSALGHAPQYAVGPDDAHRRGWRAAGETVGAWIELSWPRGIPLSSLSIERPELTVPGVAEVALAFSDGSSLQMRLSASSPTTTTEFRSRTVDRVRVTVTAVAPGARAAEIDRITTESAQRFVEPAPADGNVAPRARVSGVASPGSLVDGGSFAPAATGGSWVVPQPIGAWAELRWAEPQELASVVVLGSGASPTRLLAAEVSFSDGATLPLGAVVDDPARPTILSFMPRSTTSIKLTVTAASGPGPLSVGELRTYLAGYTPARAPTGPAPVGFTGPDPPATTCPPVAARPSILTVHCPAGDTALGNAGVLVASVPPGYTSVEAAVWEAEPGAPDGEPVTGKPDPSGTVTMSIDFSSVLAGPFTVRVVARGSRQQDQTVFLPLFRAGPRNDSPPSSTGMAAGRTLVYDDEFTSPVSLSRTGADSDYTAAKPVVAGVEDFGDAPFADPASGSGAVGVYEGLLRLGLGPEAGSDPPGQLRGSLAASARPGGSGFSAQYGYFEARIFAPRAEGTWPAFWMLPSDNLVRAQDVVAEIDAVELYGRFPRGSCHSTHDYRDGQDGGVGHCSEDRFDDDRSAMRWHTYGVAVNPTENVFTIDGRVVATAPQVPGARSPLFFLVNLAAGGGWPVDLSTIGGRAAMYVDYVRVYV